MDDSSDPEPPPDKGSEIQRDAIVSPEAPDQAAGLATYRASFDDRTESVSTVVISAVAAVSNTNVLALDPLYTVVDPDALDALVRRGPDVRVTFTYEGYEIVVHGDGEVVVTASDE